MKLNRIRERLKESKQELLVKYKRKYEVAAFRLIYINIPVGLGNLRDSLEVKWVGDDLIASVDTEYAKFVRFGYVTALGNTVAGRDFFKINFEILKELVEDLPDE